VNCYLVSPQLIGKNSSKLQRIIRAIFPEFVRLADKYERDVELRGRCATIVEALPEPPLGLWTEDNRPRSGTSPTSHPGCRDVIDLLRWFRPVQVLMQKLVRRLAVDRVWSLEKLDFGLFAQSKLGVVTADLNRRRW